MPYSYSTPLTYGPQSNMSYYEQPHKKSSALPATIGGMIIGGTAGGILGNRKNPCFSNNNEVSDSFAKAVFEETGNTKKAYKEGLEILNKIDGVKTPEELKTLLEANKEAAVDFCAETKQTPEEFLNKVTQENLSANKKTIKEKIEATNKTRIQDMKNQIESCWDKDKKKFVENEKVSKDTFKSIKKSVNNAKSKLIAKYIAIGVGIAGLIGFAIAKLINR